MKNSFSIIISFIALSLIGAAFLPLLNVQLKPDRALPKLSVSRDLDRDLALLGLICIAIGGLRSRRGVETGSKGDVWPEIAEDIVEIVVRGGPIPKEGDR